MGSEFQELKKTQKRSRVKFFPKLAISRVMYSAVDRTNHAITTLSFNFYNSDGLCTLRCVLCQFLAFNLAVHSLKDSA